MNKKKVSLSELKIQSFITNTEFTEVKTIHGGSVLCVSFCCPHSHPPCCVVPIPTRPCLEKIGPFYD